MAHALKLYDAEATLASGESPDAPVSNQQLLDQDGMASLAKLQDQAVFKVEVLMSVTEVACASLNAYIFKTLEALGVLVKAWDDAKREHSQGAACSEYADGAFSMMHGTLKMQAERVRQSVETEKRFVEARRVILAADALAKRVDVRRNSAPGIELFKVLMLVLHQLAHPNKAAAERQHALDVWSEAKRRIAAQL